MEVHFSRVCDLEKNSSDFKISTFLRAAWGLGINPDVLMKSCPGWKTRAAKSTLMVIVEYQKLHSLLLEEGVPEKVASRICEKLLS
jgi:hypothetical protein